MTLVELYRERHREQIIQLSVRAWSPVFDALRGAVPFYVYNAFYPAGWMTRQVADIENFLTAEARSTWVALDGEDVVGWVGIRLHPKDSMGEIYILAVDPERQRNGVATCLMEAGFASMRAAGMKMVMVETGGDPGHAASRATYECVGFERWPVARYFKPL